MIVMFVPRTAAIWRRVNAVTARIITLVRMDCIARSVTGVKTEPVRPERRAIAVTLHRAPSIRATSRGLAVSMKLATVFAPRGKPVIL